MPIISRQVEVVFVRFVSLPPFPAHRYVCLGGSSTPTPADGFHGYPCPAGYRCPVGSGNEVPCESGTYSAAPGAAHCTTCPPGTMCPSSATQQALICPTGEDKRTGISPRCCNKLK